VKKDKVEINPKEFAYHFIDSIQVENKKELLEDAAKTKLVGYLTAYYLADRFNEMEDDIFESARDKKIEDMSLSEFLQKVSEQNYF
jgi:hypothetical protein